MSDEAPVTTRVGGGASARIAVLVVAVTLAAIVGTAFVNRPPAPRPAAGLAVAAATTQPSVAGPSPAATDAPLPRRSPLVVNLGDDAFAAIGLIGGRQYPIVLADRGDGTLDGRMRLPFPRPDTQGTVELAQLWNRDPSLNFQSIGRWSLPLDPLMPELRGSGTVLTVEESAGTLSGDNRLERDGFHMEIRLESRADFGMIFVTVTTPCCGEPVPTPTHRLYHDDALVDVPGFFTSLPAVPPPASPSRYVFNWRGMGPGNIATR